MWLLFLPWLFGDDTTPKNAGSDSTFSQEIVFNFCIARFDLMLRWFVSTDFYYDTCLVLADYLREFRQVEVVSQISHWADILYNHNFMNWVARWLADNFWQLDVFVFCVLWMEDFTRPYDNSRREFNAILDQL